MRRPVLTLALGLGGAALVAALLGFAVGWYWHFLPICHDGGPDCTEGNHAQAAFHFAQRGLAVAGLVLAAAGASMVPRVALAAGVVVLLAGVAAAAIAGAWWRTPPCHLGGDVCNEGGVAALWTLVALAILAFGAVLVVLGLLGLRRRRRVAGAGPPTA